MLLLCGCTAVTHGCFREPADALARLHLLEDENQQLDAQLSRVEERLIGNQFQVQLWTELARRHREVSALTCSNVAMHSEQMLALGEHQADKARRLRNGEDLTFPEEGVGGPRTRSRLARWSSSANAK